MVKMRKGILKKSILLVAVAVAVMAVCWLCSCDQHTHAFLELKEIKAPTCTESGIQKAICACGEEQEKSLAPVGHKSGERIVVLRATCTQDGAYEVECTTCGELVEEGKITSLGHNIIRHGVREATCQAVGWKEYEECANCSYSSYIEIPKTAHVSSGAADCVTAESCTACGEILNDALGHTEKTVSGKKATCLRSGLSDGKVCSVCDTVLVAQIIVPKREHTPEVISGKAATCTDTGMSDGMRCTECRSVTVQPIEIPERSHTYSGSLDHDCDVCGFKRGVGAEACIHENQSTLKKIASGCAGYGLTQGVVCDDCGEVLVQQEVIVSKDHTKKTVRGYDPTCILSGLSDGGECSYCGIITKQQELIAPEGHTEIEDKPVSPTCETAGLTAGSHCAACQEITLKQNRIEPVGHDKIAYEGKAATCTESGWLPYYTCSKCSYTSFERLERGSHTEVTDAAVAATCEGGGLTEGKHCSVCGTVTLRQIEIEALGHSYGEWTTVKAGGCTDVESTVRVCTRCFDVEGKNGARYHEFKAVCTFDSCTKSRELSVICSNCNADGGSAIIAPLGHDLIWSVTESGHSMKCGRDGCGYYTLTSAHKTAGTSKCEDRVCVDCGHVVSLGVGHKLSTAYKSDANYHWNECANIGCDHEANKTAHTNPAAKCTDRNVKCSVCSKYYSPNIDHVMGNWESTKAATCTEGGVMTRKCGKCSYTETKETEKTTHSMGAWYSVNSTAKRRDCYYCDYYETKFGS